MRGLSAAVILCVTMVSAYRPTGCPGCAAGVGVALDDCGCCGVCARQLFEDCSDTRPCDHAKGLECNVRGGSGPAGGVCRAKADGRTCEYNSKIYQNGEIFRPSCRHQCACVDGAVGCVSLCPREFPLKPSRVKAPRRCCERLVRHQGATAGKSEQQKTRSRGGGPSDDDPGDRKEREHARRGKSKSSPDFSLMGHVLARGAECVSQTTAWSPCSKSCGTGLSTRVTNSSNKCKLVEETRICQIRPCNHVTFHRLKKGQRCEHTEKASRPLRLSYTGCRSMKKFQVRYCGSCPDGRCCSPHRTQTAPVRFRCRNGNITSRMVMVIESCKCDWKCPSSSKRPDALCLETNGKEQC